MNKRGTVAGQYLITVLWGECEQAACILATDDRESGFTCC